MARRKLSGPEFARRVGVTPSRIRQLCLTGRIPEAEKVGNTWIIPEGARILRPPERDRGFAKINEWLSKEDWDREKTAHQVVTEFVKEGRYWIERA